jgi:hypothetical protein
MIDLRKLISRTMQTSMPASIATTAAVAICGQVEDGNGIAPLNAISHIIWGESAAREDAASVDHTLAGVGLNTAAITAWSAVYELCFGGAARRGDVSTAVVGGISTAGLAYFTDYYVVPKRLTPGFEKRLSPASMFLVYSTLALALPLSSLMMRDKE